VCVWEMNKTKITYLLQVTPAKSQSQVI